MMFTGNSFFAPAKINLTLKVIGRLPDGYHELDTWMHKVQLFDEIIFDQGTPGLVSLSCPDSDLPEDDSNLVVRAAKTFYRLIDEQPALHITLNKKIPIAAGLGGGSSDCATVLNGLNSLFGQPLSRQMLLDEGKKLGADVPFFVENFFSARATGIGEYLSSVPTLPKCHIILVNPGIAVSTGWVFSMLQGEIPLLKQYSQDSQKTSENGNYALTRGDKTYILSRASGEGNLPNLFNDLEEVTLVEYPEIALIKKIIVKFNALNALMSGSGSTVFGIFVDLNQAIACKKNIQSLYPDWKVFLCEPLVA